MLRYIIVFLLLPLQLFAQSANTDTLIPLMRFGELADVTRQEGLVGNETLLQDFGLPTDEELWQEKLDEIFEVARIEALFEAGFSDGFNSRSTTEVLEFLQDPDWIEIVTLQNDAAIATLDPDIEAASFEVYWDHVDRNSKRLAALEKLIGTVNLIEQNIAGAMNGMITLNQGMSSIIPEMAYPEEDLFAFFLEEEESMRADISESLLSFFLMTYEPISDQVLRDQIAFWSTQAGQDLSNAMMRAYDEVYDSLTYDLGRAMAEMLTETAL